MGDGDTKERLIIICDPEDATITVIKGERQILSGDLPEWKALKMMQDFYAEAKKAIKERGVN